MKINIENVRALKPCADRFNNFITCYPDFNGSLSNFLSLDNITYSDKVWVFIRLATHVQNVKWSILCAKSCLQNFELIFPDDKRPRQAIEAAETFALNPSEENKYAARSAAQSAAEYAVWSAAASAAQSAAEYAAEYAAESAAWSAAASAESAAESAAWSAAWSAARSAEYAESAAEKAQEDLNLQFMFEAVREQS